MTQPMPKVGDYESCQDFLNDWFRWKSEQNPKFSLRNFAKSCGLKSHVHLSRILSGERPLTSDMALQLANGMKLSYESFVRLMFLSKNKKIEIEKANNPLLLRTMYTREIIKQLSRRKDFTDSPSYIHKITEGRIPESEAAELLLDLTEKGELFQEDGKWKFQKGKYSYTHDQETTNLMNHVVSDLGKLVNVHNAGRMMNNRKAKELMRKIRQLIWDSTNEKPDKALHEGDLWVVSVSMRKITDLENEPKIGPPEEAL